MYCFLALLLACGVVAKGFTINELGNKTWGPLIFTKTITRNKFYEILKLIRFDDKTRRRRRLQGDRFALFFRNFSFGLLTTQNGFSNQTVFFTIDEQLFPTNQTSSAINFGYWLTALQNMSLMDFLILARMMSEPSIKHCQIM